MRRGFPWIETWVCLIALVFVAIVLWVSANVAATAEPWTVDRLHGALKPNSLARDLLETLSFAAVLIAGVTAVAALLIARHQWTEAENNRHAQVLMTITAAFLSQEMVASKTALAKVVLAYQKAPPPNPPWTLHAYVSNRLNELFAGSSGIDEYLELMRPAYFFEYVSVLVRRRYINADDVYLMLGAALVDVFKKYQPHIRHRRALAGDVRMFEHFEVCAEIFAAMQKRVPGVASVKRTRDSLVSLADVRR